MHPMTEAAQGDYLTLQEAAALLKIDTRTLLRYEERGLIESGRLPGGGRRYRTPDVHGLLARRESDAAKAAAGSAASK